ncbi:MAG: TonB-dependent receptor [Phenylobacterium sp.]|nr:TonB-dependent receptor [Phenylobacterium sp.]
MTSTHLQARRRAGRRISLAVGSALALVLAGAPALADDLAKPTNEQADYGNRVDELTVVGTTDAARAAPVKASLEATEPQAIITREAIDQFVPQTGDYTQAVLLSPSISGLSFNGPGYYETKTTLRGFQDGQYNVTYDGIPFGDTNDPTHHSTSFFPAATIGAVVVDRGPGEAGQMGQASFGGSINLFSPEVAEEAGGSASVTTGSWNSWQAIVKANTGTIDALHGTRALIGVSAFTTDGYLTSSNSQGANFMLRSVTPINDSWKLTLYGVYNYTWVYQDDNNGLTLAQVNTLGKRFALQSGDKTSPFFTEYNTVKKKTNFNYARLDGDLTSSTHLDNTAYTYYYSNHTLSPQDTTGTRAPEKTIPAGDIPGYTKLNYYHVYGDVLRVTQDLPFGAIKAGVWLETSKSKRARKDYDLNTGLPDLAEKCPTLQPGVTCLRGAASNINYVQASTWDQYEPFVDFEFRPTDALTITPGVKYVHFKRTVNAPINQGSGTVFNGSATWTKTLYFLTANYKLASNWSAYAQYATGMLVPPLSTLQVQIPNPADEKPQESKNYQVGTVFHGGRFSLDADLYYIEFKNKFQSISVTSGPQAGETIFYNLGGAIYKGAEAQGTFEVAAQTFLFANGSLNSAKAEGGATTIAGQPVIVTGGKQIANAPKWTAAAGIIWKPQDWSISLTDKLVGTQWGAEGEPDNFKVKPYANVDLTVVRNLGRIRLEAAIYNLFDTKKLVQIKQGGKVFNTLSATDLYYFQTGRDFQVSARVNF